MADERDAYRVLQVDPEAHELVVRAAYRALATIYHPDRDASALATRRMAEINDAYSRVRTTDRREVYDRLRKRKAADGDAPVVYAAPAAPTQPAAQPAPAGNPTGASVETVDFGRYAGWTIKQLARHDPDYLKWLARHSSGIRYRRLIEAELRAAAPAPAQQPERRRRR
jgi:curved DNA-binding protein CbpA